MLPRRGSHRRLVAPSRPCEYSLITIRKPISIRTFRFKHLDLPSFQQNTTGAALECFHPANQRQYADSRLDSVGPETFPCLLCTSVIPGG